MEHTVKVTVEIPSISKVDTSYEIKGDGKKLGTLKISKGGIKYIPSKHTKGINKTWAQLHDLLTKSVIIFTFILYSCKEQRPNFIYQDHIPVEIKILKEKLRDIEKMPGMEVEVSAMKNNIAIAEISNLDVIVMQFETDYMNKNGESVPKEEIAAFKKEIKYDSLMFVFKLDVIQ